MVVKFENTYSFMDDNEEQIYFDKIDIRDRVTNYKFNFYLNDKIVYDLAYSVNTENELIFSLETEEEFIKGLEEIFSLNIIKM